MTETNFSPVGELDIPRDQWGRPKLPGPNGEPVRPWTRVSTLARTLTDEYNLNEWKTRMVAYGIGQRPDLHRLAASVKDPELERGTLTDVAQQAQDAARARSGANTGTARHAFSVTLDASDAPYMLLGGMPEADRNHMRTYLDGMAASGLSIVPGMLECQVICTEIECSGKFDRGLAGYAGHPFTIGDLKTAKLESIEYAWLEIAIQLSVYAHSTHLWRPAIRSWTPLPDINQTSAIVMHLPNDADPPRLDLYDIDIVAGWEAALLAVKVRAARSRPKRYARPLPRAEKVAEVPLAVRPAGEPVTVGYAKELMAATTVPALSAIWRRAHERGEWTPALQEIGRRRQLELQGKRS